MRGDVLEVISSTKDVTNAVILTHNIDFLFVQTLVLSAFRRCGHPTITIFADCACAVESFGNQESMLTSLGKRYRVVPVKMDVGFRFHPKAVLLSGETAATLLVGSGNLTFGGWRDNAEVWTRFESESDGTAPFHWFRGYLDEILSRVALASEVRAEIEEAFDPRSKTWVAGGTTDFGSLVGRVGSGPTLLEHMLAVGREDRVEELVICAPFFDYSGIALKHLASRVGADRTTVLCQPGRSTLQERAWEGMAASARLRGIDFTRPDSSNGERSAFVHAKFYGFRRKEQVVVLVGSANCSRAALTTQGTAGNAELMAVLVRSPDEFEKEFLDELNLISKPVVLLSEAPNDIDEDSTSPKPYILAARFDQGNLLVGYSPPSVEVAECQIDGKTAPFESIEPGIVRIRCGIEPRVVTLRVRVDGELVKSHGSWIDNERHLRATARRRSLADAIRTRVRPGEWSVGGWADVLAVFCKHVTYMPVIPAREVERGLPGERSPTDETVEFTAIDVFATDYRTPTVDRASFSTCLDDDSYIQSLQQLLLRWFGVEPHEAEELNSGTGEDDADRDEPLDRPESIPVAQTSPYGSKLAERERHRIERLLKHLEAGMTSTEFLSERNPEYLAVDLKVASALLRLGLRAGWVERKQFFDLTHRVWSALFFSSTSNRELGWLEYRVKQSQDKEAFIDSMRSAEVSAALIGWYLAASAHSEGTPETVRFVFSAVMSVAHLPWLWHGGSQDDISRELAELLSYTPESGLTIEEMKDDARLQWDVLLQRGHALRGLLGALRTMKVAEILERISTDQLRPGDLLWQGAAGFCVVLHQCSRFTDAAATVLKLQGDERETRFRARFTVPVRALLKEELVPSTPQFGDKPREVLRKFIDELAMGIWT